MKDIVGVAEGTEGLDGVAEGTEGLDGAHATSDSV